MKILSAILCAMLACLSAQAQLSRLQKVQSTRVAAKGHTKNARWDSACHAYTSIAADQKYSNPYDHLNLSVCSQKLGDSVSFATHLSDALSAGIDTATVRSFYSGATEKERLQLQQFMRDNYARLRQTFLSRYDTALLNELQGIQDMDQLVRTPIQNLAAKNPGKQATDSNVHYLLLVARYADSINYTRLIRLFRSRGYPGYHTSGAAATRLSTILMHIDHGYADWDYVLQTLKNAVLDGQMDPDQAAGIIDRHYLGVASSPSYYYGRLKWGAERPFYDCKGVDALRAEIGIESLEAEYNRAGRPLPECYNKK